MSVVLCLPAHLCVSTAASRGQAPDGNASKAFHRRGVTHPSRATWGHNPEQRGAGPPRERVIISKKNEGHIKTKVDS